MRNALRTCLTCCLLILVSGGCTDAPFEVRDAYVRAPVAQRDVTAAFMTIQNNSTAAIALTGASSPSAQRVELHQHTHVNGQMRMRQVEQIEIPAQATATLEPGGYHMMLLGIARQLAEQNTVELTLEFSNGTTLMLLAPIRSLLATNN